MQKELLETDEILNQEYEESLQDSASKRRALIFFANRSKLESLRFFIV